MIDERERLKILREEILHMTQDDFGNHLNLSKFAISNYENKKSNIPNRVKIDIYREFNVNSEWFENGIGEPLKNFTYEKQINSFLTSLLKNTDSSIVEIIKKFIITYDELKPTDKQVLEKIGKTFLEQLRKSE